MRPYFPPGDVIGPEPAAFSTTRDHYVDFFIVRVRITKPHRIPVLLLNTKQKYLVRVLLNFKKVFSTRTFEFLKKYLVRVLLNF